MTNTNYEILPPLSDVVATIKCNHCGTHYLTRTLLSVTRRLLKCKGSKGKACNKEFKEDSITVYAQERIGVHIPPMKHQNLMKEDRLLGWFKRERAAESGEVLLKITFGVPLLVPHNVWTRAWCVKKEDYIYEYEGDGKDKDSEHMMVEKNLGYAATTSTSKLVEAKAQPSEKAKNQGRPGFFWTWANSDWDPKLLPEIISMEDWGCTSLAIRTPNNNCLKELSIQRI